MSLEEHVKEHEFYGSKRINLGIQQMPSGYTILLNDDRTHYYWLCEDGREGPIDWNRWRTRRRAILDQLEKQVG